MKKIVCACAAGAATSATVATKVNRMLAERNIDAKCIHIPQCDIQYHVNNCAVFISLFPGDKRKYPCPVVPGLPFVTGVGMSAAFDKLLEALGEKK